MFTLYNLNRYFPTMRWSLKCKRTLLYEFLPILNLILNPRINIIFLGLKTLTKVILKIQLKTVSNNGCFGIFCFLQINGI